MGSIRCGIFDFCTAHLCVVLLPSIPVCAPTIPLPCGGVVGWGFGTLHTTTMLSPSQALVLGWGGISIKQANFRVKCWKTICILYLYLSLSLSIWFAPPFYSTCSYLSKKAEEPCLFLTLLGIWSSVMSWCNLSSNGSNVWPNLCTILVRWKLHLQNCHHCRIPFLFSSLPTL